jgi:hypothetical protein
MLSATLLFALGIAVVLVLKISPLHLLWWFLTSALLGVWFLMLSHYSLYRDLSY